jgi:hypothetical protein
MFGGHQTIQLCGLPIKIRDFCGLFVFVLKTFFNLRMIRAPANTTHLFASLCCLTVTRGEYS